MPLAGMPKARIQTSFRPWRMSFLSCRLDSLSFLFKDSLSNILGLWTQAHKLQNHSKKQQQLSQKMGQTQYNIGRKLKIIKNATICKSRGKSLWSISARYGLQPTQLKNWISQGPSLRQQPKSKKSVHRDRLSYIEYMEDKLCNWHDEQCAMGLGVSYVSVMKYACDIDPDFANLD